MIAAIMLAALAAFLGYMLGVRRERGRHQLIAEIEAEAAAATKARGGVRLSRIVVRR